MLTNSTRHFPLSLIYHYSPTIDYGKKHQYLRRFFYNSCIRNSMVSENKALVFKIANKKHRKKLYFHDEKGLKFL